MVILIISILEQGQNASGTDAASSKKQVHPLDELQLQDVLQAFLYLIALTAEPTSLGEKTK